MMKIDEFKKDFAVFILSHGRSNEIKTVDTLKKGNYTGKWYVVIDNEDDQEDIYREKFGEHIIQFDKKEVADRTDTGDTDQDRRVGVFARNFIQEQAINMGYKYHLQLDDDFQGFTFRYIKGDKLANKRCTDLDKLFYSVVKFQASTDIVALSFGLSSDYLGGVKSDKVRDGLFRKTMGTFFMRADKERPFVMRMNDDITTCILNSNRGDLYFSIAMVQTETPPTQRMKGGMTDAYIENGTYRKSFYSILCCPSCVKIAKMGIKNFRIHHKIKWNNCTPKILAERWKK